MLWKRLTTRKAQGTSPLWWMRRELYLAHCCSSTTVRTLLWRACTPGTDPAAATRPPCLHFVGWVQKLGRGVSLPHKIRSLLLRRGSLRPHSHRADHGLVGPNGILWSTFGRRGVLWMIVRRVEMATQATKGGLDLLWCICAFQPPRAQAYRHGG